MKEYPKIQSIYKRDEETHKFLEGQWSEPEFEYLAHNQWEWTEKVDGTNIRVIWIPEDCALPFVGKGIDPMDLLPGIKFKGKTNDAQMPTFLFAKLQQMFPIEKFREHFKDVPVCLYGEGYGRKIQKAGVNYNPTGVSFILFDVWIEGWWLKRQDIIDIAHKLDIAVVPVIKYGTIYEAIDHVRGGFESTWKGFQAEGLVGKTLPGLKNRKGERIVTKLKTKDFVK